MPTPSVSIPVVACELEFYLVDPRRDPDGGISACDAAGQGGPPRRAANLSMDAIEESSVFLNGVAAAAAEQGVPVCGAVAEYGIGQYEVNLRHVADAVLAADHAVLLKRIVKGVAQSMGMLATFMAKPFARQPGSGLHVHVSIAADASGVNRFGLEGGETLAAAGDRRHAGADVRFARRSALRASTPIAAIWARSCQPRRDWGHNNRSRGISRPRRSRCGPPHRASRRQALTQARIWWWPPCWRRSCMA